MMGMGTLEMLVIMLVAFIFLGPGKMLDGARSIGKLVGQLRRLAEEIPHINLDDEENLSIKSGKMRSAQADSTGDRPGDRSALSELDDSESPVPFKEISSSLKEARSDPVTEKFSSENSEEDKPSNPTST